MKKVINENQPREQNGFRKDYSTISHLQTINQLMGKNIMNLIDSFASDTLNMENHFLRRHKAILKAPKTIDINEIWINILEDIYTGATAREYKDNQVAEEIPILRGVMQGSPISTKLFTATLLKIFKDTQHEEKEMNVDGEKLSNRSLADDVTQTTEGVKGIERQISIVHE